LDNFYFLENIVKEGDLVWKKEGRHKGARALILKVPAPNASGNVIVEVLLADGETTLWYSDLLEVINEGKPLWNQ
jgi:hypothetical protein